MIDLKITITEKDGKVEYIGIGESNETPTELESMAASMIMDAIGQHLDSMMKVFS